jgi:hypothetical protein
MKIVIADKRVKKVLGEDLKVGDYFKTGDCDSVLVRTDMEYGYEMTGAWAVCVKASTTDEYRKVGLTWVIKLRDLTLCDKDGNPQYEEAGEEVRFGDLSDGDVFTWGQQSHYWRKIDSMTFYNITNNSFHDKPTEKGRVCTVYRNAEIHLGGRAKS